LPILGLKGRAGLDLGLTLSYNSLVWTKDTSSNSIKFDADLGTPSPGFRLGFPVIQQRYFNSQVGVYAYLLITPSGSHVELRQVGTSNVYEAGDSSYLQLTDNGNGSLTLRPTDGSQLSYTLYNGQYQCTQIKDRNGNFITVTYNDGRINTVTDTLARVITFNYDAYLNLNSITQTWNGATHTWATFGWSNQIISTSFSGLTVVGPQNNTSIPVLTQVSFADGTHYNFEYNGYAQVTTVRHYAADNHQLSYTSHTLPVSASDCPRVSESREWAEYWNNNLEAMTAYSTASDYSSGQMTMPDRTVYKELYATSGWQKGLTTRTEVWAPDPNNPGILKNWKYTTASYTQDDINLNYQKNPLVTETNVYDSDNNHKKVTIDYGQYAQYGLPYVVREYAANGTTILRETYTDYNLSQAYLNQRIIGLVSAVRVTNGSSDQSKTVYTYDEGGNQMVATQAAATQHDPAYSTSFLLRGNVTSVARYDVNYINDANQALTNRIGYDTDGSVVSTSDPAGHQTLISYVDSFTDGVNRNTFAYPTMTTDSDGDTSSTQYTYDFGAVNRTQTPAPANQPQGAIQTFDYDSAGRLTRINNVNNGAYKQIVYDPYGHVLMYDTVQAGSLVAYSVEVYDGAGRVRRVAGDNPGNSGQYWGRETHYDVMGRVSEVSNTTEMTGEWLATGDDAAGWVWTLQQYDWKGRPTLTINPDGTTKLVEYGGCGCAGGEVVTVRDEVGRKERVTSDALGRVWKTEHLNRDDNYSVYSTVLNTYNARDQITNVKHYQGAEGGAYQESVMTYDGYGRLQTTKAPEQTSPTSYSYYPDGMTNVVTDARGATQSFTYNNRHQVTGITYGAPIGSNIAVPSPVSFDYDAAGNRRWMMDGSGRVDYSYDALSRLRSETRSFSGLTGTFTLSYDYNLAGELTSITDPTGAAIGYAYDKIGRLSGVTSSGFGSISQYASNIQYRAWGGLKRLSFGDSGQNSVSLNYTDRMKVSDYQVDYTLALTATHRVDYQYQADGRLGYSSEMEDPDQDRSYSYDHQGRLTQALTGAEARGAGGVSPDYIPFRQNYSYDVWDNLTSRTGQHWGHNAAPHTATYVNNKNTNSQWQYDAAGNLTQQTTPQGTRQYGYDAAGRQVLMTEPGRRANEVGLTMTQAYDGDGRRVKLAETTAISNVVKYEVRSSVLGGRVVTDLNAQGQKETTYVYANGAVLARQSESNKVTWVHNAPDGSGDWESYAGPTVGSIRTTELDPLGDDVGVENPYLMGGDGVGNYPRQGDPTDMTSGCILDNNFSTSCDSAMKFFVRFASKVEVYRSVGMRVANLRTNWVPNPDTSSAYYGGIDDSSVTVVDGGGHFEVYQEGSTIQWLTLLPTTQIRPQQTGQQGGPCDQKLAKIFGGPGAVAAGSNYEPKDMPGMRSGQYRGDYIGPHGELLKGHLQNMMHLYGSSDGRLVTGAYVPAGYSGRPYANPRAYDEIKGGSFVFFYPRLGDLRNVSLVATHIANFNVRNEGGRIRIGDIGGPGGDSSEGNPNDPYIHAHFTLVQGRVTANRSLDSMKHISFPDAFCK
jgi:YD repeat-containing protein